MMVSRGLHRSRTPPGLHVTIPASALPFVNESIMSMHLHKWKCVSPVQDIIVIAEVTLGSHYAAAS